MAITTKEIPRIYRYNGIELPAPPGMAPRDVRDLHSAIYPELISAEIVVADELVGGAQEITFRRNVGTKGRR
ncbi:PRTRC system protein C [Pseudoduganella namucuonensis]|uniref:PRTRC system protein C n=1 Tax=Pseudoduganella namucuonensis TaxID=1035707 RepID=A0A1I7M4H0_9BURK|nr:PRTRC system protein C [Pseudoduganella namucuonensis]SFV16825.1 PRTRC system protein C [Pseudoduganella namucuonensis]